MPEQLPPNVGALHCNVLSPRPRLHHPLSHNCAELSSCKMQNAKILAIKKKTSVQAVKGAATASRMENGKWETPLTGANNDRNVAAGVATISQPRPPFPILAQTTQARNVYTHTHTQESV